MSAVVRNIVTMVDSFSSDSLVVLIDGHGQEYLNFLGTSVCCSSIQTGICLITIFKTLLVSNSQSRNPVNTFLILSCVSTIAVAYSPFFSLLLAAVFRFSAIPFPLPCPVCYPTFFSFQSNRAYYNNHSHLNHVTHIVLLHGHSMRCHMPRHTLSFKLSISCAHISKY